MFLLRYLSCIVIYALLHSVTLAQSPYRIALINDDDVGFAPSFEQSIIKEITDLLGSRTEVEFSSYVIKDDASETDLMIEEIYANNQADLIIGAGIIASINLSHREPYSIPTIASVVTDRNLLNLPIDENDGSGIKNFTYIQTPFDVEKDLKLFYELFPYKNLGILLDTEVGQMQGFFRSYFRSRIPDSINFELLRYQETPQKTLEVIGDNFDAVYILSFLYFDEEEVKEFYHELNHRGIATFSLTGREQVRLGAMAGLAPSNFTLSMQRRLALDVMNIYEGADAGTLSTTIPKTGDDFVINMQTLKHLKIYPDFDLLNQAILLDIEVTEGLQAWTIESLIYEALRTNLGLSVAQKSVDLSDQDIKIAASNLKPQFDLSSSAAWIDPTRVDNSNGQAADVSWLANATLNQVIYNEPAMANVAIQKILKESQNEYLRQVELDIVLETAAAYLNYLQARSITRIQNENVDVTNQNLNISESKEALGYSSISDVYRLKTQLAQNIIDLNSSLSNLNQARININRIINRDQTEEFNIADLREANEFSLGGRPELENVINNQGDLDRLTDFFVERCFTHLPELKQIEFSIQAQERSLLSSQRSLYLPKLNLQAAADQPIQYFGAAIPPQGFPGLKKDLQLSLSAQVALPIFQGGLRKATIQRDKVSVDQLRDQHQDLLNSLEAQLRSNMQILSASYQKVELANSAAEFSDKNFEIVQDLYRQGQADIIRLVDAQNASLSSELNANNALYQLLIDFLTVERSTGGFYFLMSEGEQADYIREFIDAVMRPN